ncbi:MAG: HD-GYP domain-containing protein [Lachnospiraceae bacterium]|nr:HD-GYP domain-containing protein [Lachnospiraceae bacterium]
MDKAKSHITEDRLTRVVKLGLVILFAITLITIVIALFDPNNEGEAAIGSFGTKDFNEGWTLNYNGTSSQVSLPMYVPAASGDEIIISNRLPKNLSNGMSLMVRASMEDVVIYIDGKKREEYSSDSFEHMSYYIPSAYIVTGIDGRDSGKPITIRLTVKSKGSINAVTIGHGNNGWFNVIKNGLAVNFIALLAFLSGVLITATALILGKRYKTNSAGYLGLLVMDVTLWMFSESVFRQLIFSRPSMSQFFSYITLELIGALACMYFDAVQHRVYHKIYLIMEGIILVQITANILLSLSGVCELYVTLPMMHVMEAACAILVIVNVITDVRTGRINTYKKSVIGVIFFITLSLVELARFYFSEFVIFGGYMCIGLIGLMAATIAQTVSDVFAETREHERKRAEMTNNTIETIAGAIDARDEYTGGHSERVGFYAQRLAREMADKYELTEEDILRIGYIGMVHDIGKIGVAEGVLNKAGKLTNEEFSLMKRHAEIGYELMGSMGSEIEGILDGIRHHHERFDGKGYPDGIAGKNIPLIARILCLADSYDAMTSNRVYRKRLTNEEVKNELIRCSGTQFDPDLTEIFIKLIDRGDLRESTVEGMAVNAKGEVSESALLEDRMQRDMKDGIRIIHPSHVRMLCYLIKLMEKKGRSFQVMFIGPKGSEDMTEDDLTLAGKNITTAITGTITGHDVSIRYSDRFGIVALYERTETEIQAFKNALMMACPDTVIEDLK